MRKAGDTGVSKPYFSPYFTLTEAQVLEIAKRGSVPGFLAVQINEILVK